MIYTIYVLAISYWSLRSALDDGLYYCFMFNSGLVCETFLSDFITGNNKIQAEYFAANTRRLVLVSFALQCELVSTTPNN